ncbi:lipoprotein NlpI [Rodentibacter pneumotropicus]|uniref:Lipoprotein NlpI n=1 Tax=Rodentibacter pneumotropicus TaxID=758 RepID=A0A3S4U9P9_9PAST|nr:lipoprotein NlpI [Rodentibacter pneumotropicus]
MANQVYNFVEYRFASFELMKLKPAQTQQEKEVKSAVTKTENFRPHFIQQLNRKPS